MKYEELNPIESINKSHTNDPSYLDNKEVLIINAIIR
jgi:hypothetical protein